MIFKTSYCKSLTFVVILCIFQRTSAQSRVEEKVSADNLDTSRAIISISKNYNNLIDIFRKNWESPMAYLIQRGYIPINEAKPDKKSRDAIKKMQKEYGESEDNAEKALNLLQGLTHVENCKLEIKNGLNANFLSLRESKNSRRDLAKPPCTTTSPLKAPVTEMKCVKWEPVPVSTTSPGPIPTTSCRSPPAAVDPSKPNQPSPPPISSSIAPKPAGSNDTCEEYYDDVTECYEDEVYEDGSSATTLSSPLSSTTAGSMAPATESLPQCTTPSLIEHNELVLPSSPKVTDVKVNNDLNLSWHPYNIKKYKDPPISEKQQTDSDNPAFKLAKLIAKNTVKEYLRNSFYRPKTLKLDDASGLSDINYETRLKRTKDDGLYQYTKSVFPKQLHSWRSYPLSWHSKTLPTIGKSHPGPHPPNIRPSNERHLPHKNFKLLYQHKENPNLIGSSKNKFTSENNDLAKSKANVIDYDYISPNSDSGAVSLNAIYVVNDRTDKKSNTDISAQQFDNIEQSAMSSFKPQPFKSFDCEHPLFNKVNSLKELHFPFDEESMYKQKKLIVSKDSSQQAGVKAENPITKLNNAPSFKQTTFHVDMPWKSPNFYNTPTNNYHLSNINQVANKVLPIWSQPALTSSKETEDDSIYAKYQAKNDPFKQEFWQSIQGADKGSTADIFEKHSPDPLTYPHNKLLNLYKYKNMNKNLENYFRFNHEQSELGENQKTGSSKKNEGNKEEQQNLESNFYSRQSPNDLANSIIDAAVRNVTATTLNNLLY